MTDHTEPKRPMSDGGPRTEPAPAEVAEIRATAFRVLWASGRATTITTLAALLPHLSARAVADDLRWLVDRGRARVDDGVVVGVAGLSAVPTRHRITMDERERFTWCAIDALGILASGRFDGTVHSTPPGGERPVVVRFVAGTPAETGAAVFVVGDEPCASVVDDWCPNVNLFSDATAARAWQSRSGVSGEVVDVAEAAARAAPSWQPLLP